MANSTKFVRESFIEMLEAQRGPQRCDLVRDLHTEFENTHPDLYTAVTAAEEALKKAEKAQTDQHAKLTLANENKYKAQAALNAAKKARDDAKREEKLFNTVKRTASTCSIGELHPMLAAFDKETDDRICEILTLPVVTKEVLDFE